MLLLLFCLRHRSQLPARATRLLNRSRVQHGIASGIGGGSILSASAASQHGSESPRSLDSFSRRTTSARSRHSHLQQQQQQNNAKHLHHHHLHQQHQQHPLLLTDSGSGGGGATTDASRDSMHSSDDSGLFVLDKLARNTMLQDVQSFKKQLLQLRSVLQQVRGIFLVCTICVSVHFLLQLLC